jgi:isoprenylcysteine carboxyl methyltransferase (ICMT) family protein YpbQ
MDVTPLLKDKQWAEGINKSTLKMFDLSDVGQKGIYAIPWAINYEPIYYNIYLFKKAGIDKLPENWDQFLEVIRKLKEANIIPIEVGGKDSWRIGHLHTSIFYKMVGVANAMNRKIGMISSLVTLAAVLGFAGSMIVGSNYGSYLSSLFIAWGFVPMICSFAAVGKAETKSAGNTAIAFSSVYALLISIVYFAQMTTVHLSSLNEQASTILDYQTFGLFFNYDLLGYAFMALSTFFIALTIYPKGKVEKWLKALFLIHGIFAVSCVVMPLLGVFKPNMPGGSLIGVLVLEFWCLYFTPVCILSFLHFKNSGY